MRETIVLKARKLPYLKFTGNLTCVYLQALPSQSQLMLDDLLKTFVTTLKFSFSLFDNVIFVLKVFTVFFLYIACHKDLLETAMVFYSSLYFHLIRPPSRLLRHVTFRLKFFFPLKKLNLWLTAPKGAKPVN